MIGLILIVLIICALIAAIFGRGTAQKLFGCFAAIGMLFLIGIGVVLIAIAHMAPSTANTTGSVGPTIPTMGITCEPLNAENGAKYGLTPGEGIFVDSVTPGGGAAQAGIVPGDYIDSVGYYWVSSARELQNIEVRHRSGDVVPVEVLANGRKMVVNVTLH